MVQALSKGYESTKYPVKRILLHITIGLVTLLTLAHCDSGSKDKPMSERDMQARYREMQDSLTREFTAAYEAFEAEVHQNLTAQADDGGAVVSESLRPAHAESGLKATRHQQAAGKTPQRRPEEAYVLTEQRAALLERGIITEDGKMAASLSAKAKQWMIARRQVIRKDRFRYVPLESTQISIITPHPVQTYRLMSQKGGEAEMEILDSGTFWQRSSYLIVAID